MRAHTGEKVRGIVSLGLIVAIIALFTPIGVWGNTESAVGYLKANPPAGGPNPWITMALVAAGESVSVEYLKGTTGDTAIAYEAPILAIAAAGENPRTFPNTNLVEKLKSFHTNNQIGDASLVNDDIFGLLALVAAGESTSSQSVQDAKTFITDQQKGNGSWSYGTSGSEDTNTTAAAVMALITAGVSKNNQVVQSALTYLRSAQNEDGGFPYDPESPWGTASDASSDAWVISALHASGEDVNAWAKNGNTPITHLQSLQKDAGYFENQLGAGETSFTPTETAYALIALLGKSYPVTVFQVEMPLVTYRIEGKETQICKGETHAPNALELVKITANECGFTYEIVETSYGPYLKKIGSDGAEGTSGWMYAVNMEMPEIGAVDYALQDGDEVFWRFGTWEEMMAALEEKEEVTIPLEVTVAGTSGGGGGGGAEAPGISFRIEKVSDAEREPEFRFSSARPGEALKESIMLKNNGTSKLYMESVVTGDSLFRDNLTIDEGGWRTFKATILPAGIKNADVGLTVPAGASAGTKTGTLTFWAVKTQ
ncbi:MAG: DUF4430 domain-containing protein [bacterium]|nr:DUF4430 domain-containing protein [bacterium]